MESNHREEDYKAAAAAAAASGLSLQASGLFMDEVHRLRILDPMLSQQSIQLKAECDTFLSRTRRFEDVVQTFQREAARMAQAVESEKRRSIGYRLLLDDLRKKKDQQLRNKMATVDAKRKEIELLKLQTALVLVGDGVHREILDHFAP